MQSAMSECKRILPAAARLTDTGVSNHDHGDPDDEDDAQRSHFGLH